MKWMLPALLLLAGCAHVVTPQGDYLTLDSAGTSVINNTGYPLDIYQDGRLLVKNAGTGSVTRVLPPVWRGHGMVSVIAHTPDGVYVGTDSRAVVSGVASAWTVTDLWLPVHAP